MKQWYDEEEDVLGIRLQNKLYWKSIELPNGIIIDVSKDGNIIGLEILGAKKIFSGDTKKVIDVAEEQS